MARQKYFFVGLFYVLHHLQTAYPPSLRGARHKQRGNRSEAELGEANLKPDVEIATLRSQ
jgi:hypothetical protein